MRSTLVVIGLGLSALLGGGTYVWCESFGGCHLGKYEANLTLTDAETKEPLADKKVASYIDYGAFFFIGIEKESIVRTDDKGQANIEFTRAFNSPLSFRVVSDSPETRTLFGFFPKEIRANSTVSKTKTSNLITGGAESGSMTLTLDIGNWSLF